jgi:hypothetical protein
LVISKSAAFSSPARCTACFSLASCSCGIRQHTSAYAYVRMRQPTSACVSKRGAPHASPWQAAPAAYASIRQHTSAYAIRQHTSAYVSIRQNTSEYVSIRHPAAYVSIRQHKSAYVSIRQHTSSDSIRQHTSEKYSADSHATQPRGLCQIRQILSYYTHTIYTIFCKRTRLQLSRAASAGPSLKLLVYEALSY